MDTNNFNSWGVKSKQKILRSQTQQEYCSEALDKLQTKIENQDKFREDNGV